jgi:antitoxin (DNA-binding transcriptional repressor) of toxin-antitoxin stability system
VVDLWGESPTIWEIDKVFSPGETMTLKTVDVNKTRKSLKRLLSMVSAGTEIIITEGDNPIARLIPAGIRVAGLHTGSIWTSKDFDEPLPDEFWVGN